MHTLCVLGNGALVKGPLVLVTIHCSVGMSHLGGAGRAFSWWVTVQALFVLFAISLGAWWLWRVLARWPIGWRILIGLLLLVDDVLSQLHLELRLSLRLLGCWSSLLLLDLLLFLKLFFQLNQLLVYICRNFICWRSLLLLWRPQRDVRLQKLGQVIWQTVRTRRTIFGWLPRIVILSRNVIGWRWEYRWDSCRLLLLLVAHLLHQQSLMQLLELIDLLESCLIGILNRLLDGMIHEVGAGNIGLKWIIVWINVRRGMVWLLEPI